MLRLWDWFDGRKTTFGAVGLFGVQVLQLIAPALVPLEILAVVTNVFTAWTGVGLGDKVRKFFSRG